MMILFCSKCYCKLFQVFFFFFFWQQIHLFTQRIFTTYFLVVCATYESGFDGEIFFLSIGCGLINCQYVSLPVFIAFGLGFGESTLK